MGTVGPSTSPQEPSLYLDTCTWEPSLGDLYLATFAWQPWLVNLCLGTLGEWVLELLRLACNHGNLENLGRQTLSGTYPQKPWGPLPGKREVLLGNLYLGHLTWEPCGILRQDHLYFTWKLETFTCKPSPANLPLGTLWEPVPEACQPLLWNLYICFWLRTLTWKPCGNHTV